MGRIVARARTLEDGGDGGKGGDVVYVICVFRCMLIYIFGVCVGGGECGSKGE